jgi:hypothetical protein
MAQREKKLDEIKNRIHAIGDQNINNPLRNAQTTLQDLHAKMKTVMADLGKYT